jgi:hypothetical protein
VQVRSLEVVEGVGGGVGRDGRNAGLPVTSRLIGPDLGRRPRTLSRETRVYGAFCALDAQWTVGDVQGREGAMQYSPQELERIYRQLRPGSLLVPIRPEKNPTPEVGPRFMVFRMYSELNLEPADPKLAYWQALQEADVINAVGELSWINANLSEARDTDRQVHWDMVVRFVDPNLVPRIPNRELQGAVSIVFNRIGCLLTIRHLILYGGGNPREWSVYKVGRLALLANDFVQNTPTPPSESPSNLDLLLLTAPTWDVYNVRNLGHAMSRMFTMLTEILPGDDATVKKLLAQTGISPDKIAVNGVPLAQFAALVFGLFAYGRSPGANARVLFDAKVVFSQTGFPQALLDQFLDARARTVDQFRELFSKGQPISKAMFTDELTRRSFLIDSLNTFRTHPFVKIDSEKIVMLDLQFIAELITSGVYWSLYDGLLREKREPFKQLWGRMFELYAVNLLAHFYPPLSRMLSADIEYDGGQIDAFLDFGTYVLVFEIKSSLLTEPAKRSADKDSFVADFRRKFVENENGKPKAIKQLASAAHAILAGEIDIAKKKQAPVIYPIFVSDEPAVEATFMNAFFNEEFQKEGISDSKVKPLTIMSIDELEQTLSHVTDNDFNWEEMLDSRFNDFGVYPNSVGQAIYALTVTKGLASKQNPALKQKYDEFGAIMRKVYEKPADLQAQDEVADKEPNKEQ